MNTQPAVTQFREFTIEQFYNNHNKPTLRISKPSPRGKYSKIKYVLWYYFHTEEAREKSLNNFIARETEKVAQKEKKAEAIKAAKQSKIHPYQKGVIVYASWGYEQTNINFYEVTRVNGFKIELSRLHATRTEKGFMQGETEPVKGSYTGEVITKIVQVHCHNGTAYHLIKHEYMCFNVHEEGKTHWCSWYA